MFNFCQKVQIVHHHHHHYELIIDTCSKRSLQLTTVQSSNETSRIITIKEDENIGINQQSQPARYLSKNTSIRNKSKGISVTSKFEVKKSLLSNKFPKDLGLNAQIINIKQKQICSSHSTHIELGSNKKKTIHTKTQSKTHHQRKNHLHRHPLQLLAKIESNPRNNTFIHSTKLKVGLGKECMISNYKDSWNRQLQSKAQIETMQLQISKNAGIYETKKKQQHYQGGNFYNDKTISKISSDICCGQRLQNNKQRMSFSNQNIQIIIHQQRYNQNCQYQSVHTHKYLNDAISTYSKDDSDNFDPHFHFDQSIIINRELDYFNQIVMRKSIGMAEICLAVEKQSGLLTCLKIYEEKAEIQYHKQLNNYEIAGRKQHPNDRLNFLELYQILSEGSTNKKLYFVHQPYQKTMQDFLQQNIKQLTQNSNFLKQLLDNLTRDITNVLAYLSNCKLYLKTILLLQDIVIISDQYKLHSLSKFDVLFRQQSDRQDDSMIVGKLVESILKKLRKEE